MSKEISAEHIGKMIRVRLSEDIPWEHRIYMGRCGAAFVCNEKIATENLCLWSYAEPIPEPRELKATDLIGWWCRCHEGTAGPLIAMEDKISTLAMNWHSLDEIVVVDDWRFTKDPFTPLDQWITLDEVREGLK